ncbi:MAG: 50S ribosomal protein L11 methyltransferase [Myxococcaceae bacterium]|nr:50S ribosomal protein L11 methyltransferase [Myxococcaceae bacterium]MCI0669836.1 50S ribosomal protein L11 methyltransferase [Myxococcaceae bacterium]
MADTYLSLTVDLPEAEAEALEDALHEAGALGLEVRDAEAPPMPGVRGPSPGEAIVVAYFDERAAAESARERVASDFPAARLRLEEVVQQDWSTAWRQHIHAVEVGRLWVGPPWQLKDAPADKVRLVIEPKMAFGTGDHPTTSLCLAAVDDFMASHPGASVLDVGTGTGVLAIAARRLGAGRVVGVDNDATSVELARENAQVNGTPEVELSGTPLEEVPGTFDLVLANILANTLIELAPALAAHTGQALVLAGVLAHQADAVGAAFRAQGLTQLKGAQVGEWVRLDFRR